MSEKDLDSALFDMEDRLRKVARAIDDALNMLEKGLQVQAYNKLKTTHKPLNSLFDDYFGG